jgi:hypothetical protein
MKNEEKIRKYIEGELSGEELLNFEKEITNSPELKREINSLRNALNQFEKLKNVNAEENYFTNILPQFIESVSKQKQLKIKPSFALGSIILVSITLIVLFITTNKQDVIENEQITLQQLDNEELKTYLNNSSQDLTTSQLTENIPEEYDTLFNSLVAEELSLNGYSGEYLVDVTSNEFYNILDELSEEEVDGIYNNILKKEF